MITIKKVLTTVFVICLVLCCTVAAYAADIYTCPVCNRKYDSIALYNDCIDSHNETDDATHRTLHKCGTCGKLFADLSSYNACVDSHFNNVDYYYERYVGLTVPELMAELVDIFNKTGTMEIVEETVDRCYDMIMESADSKLVLSELSKLEEKANEIGFNEDSMIDIETIIDELKDNYCCDEEPASEEIEVTEATTPADTGNANAGIVAFAAISATATAAFVMLKKKR